MKLVCLLFAVACLYSVFGSRDAPPREARALDPALADAVAAARRDARRDGIELRITSGLRSARHQQELLDEAIARYGS